MTEESSHALELAEYLEDQTAKECDGVHIGSTDAKVAAKALRVMVEISIIDSSSPHPGTG